MLLLSIEIGIPALEERTSRKSLKSLDLLKILSLAVWKQSDTRQWGEYLQDCVKSPHVVKVSLKKFSHVASCVHLLNLKYDYVCI